VPRPSVWAIRALCVVTRLAPLLHASAPSRVDYLVAVAEVPFESPLAHEHPPAVVLDEDLARGIEEVLRWSLGFEFGLLAGLRGAQGGGPPPSTGTTSTSRFLS
jgi:hypothetical protein